MLLNDKYIAYFSLYSSIDPNNVQLFLHAHPQYFNYVIHLLQLGAGVFEGSHPSIEERYEILPGSIIRLSGRDVPFGLTFVIPHLTCEEDFSELRKQVVAAKLNLPSTPWQPLLPPSPPHQAYTYADHTAEAIKAAKTNNELVLNILLGDKVTSIADRDAQLAAKNAEIAAQNARIERIEQELVENKKVWQEQQLMMQQLLGALRSQTNIASGGQQNVASLFSSSSPTFFSNTAAAAAASSAPAMPMPVCGGSQ